MALSEELKKVYTSNPVGIRYYDTIELTHSAFSQVYYMVKDADSHSWDVDGVNQTFSPYPFSLVLPEVGSPQQDLGLVFDNAGRELMSELEAAGQVIKEPIKVTYRVYIDGSNLNQISPIKLVLTAVTADAFSISATATRPSLYQRKIPSGNHSVYHSRFPGLWL